jgi:tRNA pseudouridine55 synthase
LHSAKKKNGVPLYELARQGIEIERDPKLCHLYDFSIVSYHAPQAGFTLRCSSGTYVRALAKDLATHLGSVALLDTLHRTSSGVFNVAQALSTEEIFASQQKWDELPCWIPFDQLLSDYDRAEATEEERVALVQGKQEVLTPILGRMQSNVVRSAERSDCIALYCADALIAIARKDHDVWGLERVFT